MRRFTFFAVGVLLLVPRLAAQQPTGFPPYGSFQQGGFDSINVENLNVNSSIPIVSVPGRGSSFNYAITYNSAVWMYHPNGGSGWYWIPVSIFPHSGSWGWNYDPGAGGILYDEFIEYCEPSDEYALHVTNFRLMEPNGTTHSFALDFYDVATECSFGPVGGQAGHSTDGQGFKIDATGWPYVGYGPDGAKFVGFGPATVTDANGNYFTTGPTPLLNTWVNYTDTVGRTVLKIYKEASKVTYQYQDASGAWQTVELNLSTFNIKTNFACPSVSEYTGTAKLPVSLVLANGKQYTFTYEDTPGWAGYKSGRLKRVTFPTGGYYEYSYPTTGNKGISCPSWSGGDGRTTSLTRVINDGVSSSTWQYSATMSGTYPNHFWTTTVTAPTLPYDSVGNQSSYTFGSQGNSRTETHYQGSSSALRTIQTTFTPDANWVKRPTTIVTILENDQQSKVENTFDLFGEHVPDLVESGGSGGVAS